LKAVRFHAPGGPEVLTYEEVPRPSTRRGEVLVKVAACGVNRIDVWLRSGRYKTYTPHILGTDVSGVVAEAPAGVAGLEVGQKVVAYPSLSDGSCRYCVSGHPNRCIKGGLLGAVTDGGYAEYVSVPASTLIETGSLDSRVAAAAPVNFATAWSALAERGGVGAGDRVLVWGAAGGLGHAAVEIAKLLGATVIATAGSKEKLRFAESLGADRTIDHSTEEVPARVRDFTDGDGVDFVFDHIGGDTWARSIDSLAKGGTLLSLGLTSGPRSDVDVGKLYRNELRIIGVFGFPKDSLVQVLRLLSEGKLKPRIFKELPLQAAREAHQILESRAVQGKILLVP